MGFSRYLMKFLLLLLKEIEMQTTFFFLKVKRMVLEIINIESNFNNKFLLIGLLIIKYLELFIDLSRVCFKKKFIHLKEINIR